MLSFSRLAHFIFFFFQAEDGIRDAQESRGLGDVYKRQVSTQSTGTIHSTMAHQDVPESFLCSITSEIMTDPVMDPDGYTYERDSIAEWLDRNPTSPHTRAPLQANQLIPNRALREAIEEWCARPQEASVVANNTHPSVANSSVVGVQLVAELEAICCRDPTNSEGMLVLLEATTPSRQSRVPVDICCVVDVSGSMSAEATIQSQAGASESHGLTLLDIVKHAVRTVIGMLDTQDRLALVIYSNQAEVAVPLLGMNAAGKAQANRALANLKPFGGTNLWDGLQAALEMFRGTERHGRVASTMLLTDGVPNINPPRGILPMFDRYISKYPLPCAVNTFGFGYNLDSKLLEALASAGNGMYSFIPDSGFVGTSFIHMLSNTLVSMAPGTVGLDLSSTGGMRLLGHEVNTLPRVELGMLQYGFTRSCVIQCTAEQLVGSTAVLQLGQDVVSQAEIVPGDEGRIISAARRLLFVEQVRCAMDLCATHAADEPIMNEARQQLRHLRETLLEMGSAGSADPLLLDLDGQIAEAFSRKDWFQKWGVHYMRALLLAHKLRQCTNFKDPGLQQYASGDLFEHLRDQADDLFMKLPPPEPTARAPPRRSSSTSTSRSTAAPARAAPVDMSMYNNCNNPCFAGECLVEMGDGTSVTVASIKRGDIVMSANRQPARVVCVLKTHCGPACTLVELPGGLHVTPWHPIRTSRRHDQASQCHDHWEFPANMAEPRLRECEFVFSFVLERGHVMWINQRECICLGHGISEDPVACHPFFGTQKVVAELERMRGWKDGLVQMKSGCVIKDPVNGLAVGFSEDSEVCTHAATTRWEMAADVKQLAAS
eukprot:TRINITY_DN49470_c0_g1_i1.p1 TRINITY_DN49470_c0_g1~~TRINITY_DN49470_c0_g1_i1.p1  ORF type:complete len:829 (-),score=171.09 TRINITY_DN49470_c0_g1_i1:117-2603(-)